MRSASSEFSAPAQKMASVTELAAYQQAKRYPQEPDWKRMEAHLTARHPAEQATIFYLPLFEHDPAADAAEQAKWDAFVQ